VHDFEGQGIVTTLTFESDLTGRQVSMRCRGKRRPTNNPNIFTAGGSTSTLIENLADLVYDAIVNVHDVRADEWNAPDYTRAFLACESLGYEGGGVILDDLLPVTLANAILQPIGGAVIGGDGQLHLYIETVPSGLVPVVEPFLETEIEHFTATREVESVTNEIRLAYAFNWRKQRFQSLLTQFDRQTTRTDPDSQLTYKVRARNLEAPWIRTSTVAQAATAKLIQLSRTPRWTFALQLKGYRAMNLQPGDVVAFTHRKVPGGSASGRPGYQRLMRVRRLEVETDGSGVTLTGIDLGQNYG
jgi:hypothetical protein